MTISRLHEKVHLCSIDFLPSPDHGAEPGLWSPLQGLNLVPDLGCIPDSAGRHPLWQGAAVDQTRGGEAGLAAQGARPLKGVE